MQSFCHLFEEMDASRSQEGSIFKSDDTDHLVIEGEILSGLGLHEEGQTLFFHLHVLEDDGGGRGEANDLRVQIKIIKSGQ